MTASLDRCTPELCALVSRRAGEDPIGTAPTQARFLLVELPMPWPRSLAEEERRLPGLSAVLLGLPGDTRTLATGPQGDLDPELTRIVEYRRPEGPWATMTRREFVAPHAQVAGLVAHLLKNDVSGTRHFEVESPVTRDLLVCTHGSVDAACGKLGYPLFQYAREHLVPKSGGTLRVARVSHFGGHRFAPTVLDFPMGRAWAHLTTEALDRLVNQDGDPGDLRAFHRGWSGLDFFGQVVDREILEREGWSWLAWQRWGGTVHTESGDPRDPVFSHDPPAFAHVELHFEQPGGMRGTYAATVEHTGHLLSPGSTGAEPQRVNRWRVSRIERTR